MTENKNPNAKDRPNFKWATVQVINKLERDYDFAVINTDNEPAPYAPSEKKQFNDGRIVTYGEGTRHVASGRKAILERKFGNNYEVRPYESGTEI